MADNGKAPLLDPSIFTQLKDKIDEESQVHDRIHEIVQRLSAVNSYAQGLLSRVHATPRAKCESSYHHCPGPIWWSSSLHRF